MSTLPLWRTIQKRNFTNWAHLADFLELSSAHRAQLLRTPTFSLNLPERLANKIQKNQLDDPILRQFVPLQEETLSSPGFVQDPIQDLSFRQTHKLLKKYAGRALIVTTRACAMHCRFCFRQNFPYETQEVGFESEIEAIAKDREIQEVILSGGDPLSLSDASLGSLLTALTHIPHLQRIRFHTRFPIGIPDRIDHSFLTLLSSCPKQIIFVIHCNHPKEFDADVARHLKQLQTLGIPVLNQSVLLRGVNDDEETLLSLSQVLINGGVLPYYLHQLDPVQGAAHFAVSDQRALSLIHFLQERLSGYGVPRLVRENPGYPSKSPIY